MCSNLRSDEVTTLSTAYEKMRKNVFLSNNVSVVKKMKKLKRLAVLKTPLCDLRLT